MVHSLGKSATGLSNLSVPKLTPVATISREKSKPLLGVFIDSGISNQRKTVQGVGVNRDSALYSLCRRHCTTSNCSGPTAASSVEPGGAFLAEKDWTTPSCNNCSRPARYFLASPVFGFEM